VNRPESAVLIRAAELTDLPGVRRIEQVSFDDPWSDNALGGELLADDLRLPLVAVLGAGCEEQFAGYLMAWKVVDQLHVLNIAVDPALRRGGIATALLAEAARRAQELGLREVTLEVRRGNDPAVEFYLRHGFIEVGVREGYYADSGEDALIMTCSVAHLSGLRTSSAEPGTE
jgi:[ribosomal protein S18]-alanine N-acetyltransferase